MLTAQATAQYFLSLTDDESGDVMTNLKLQKLLYYAQGLHLALFHSPLFNDPVEARMHGPVVRSVYFDYNEYGNQPIPKPEDFEIAAIDADTRQFLDEVYEVYGQFSAWKLRNMIHQEMPWKNTDINHVITHDKLEQFFQTRIIDDD